MTNLEKAEIIGILLHDKFQVKKDYKLLPIKDWTEAICNTIFNSVKVDNERAFFAMSDSDKNKIESLKNEEILSKFEVLEKTSEKTGLPKNAELFKAPLGEASPDYVRFANKDKLTVIFNADNISDDKLAKYAERCLSDLWLGLSLLTDVAGKKDELRKYNKAAVFDEDKERLDTLQQICAVQANFTVNKRPEIGSDHDIWNELLQNANDHIPNTGIVEIRIGNDGLELEYPDEGFSVRDFVAVCTLGNSGNEGNEKNTEGRKGTGFKSIYNLFRKVTITSNDIECVLEDSKRNLSISYDRKSIEIGKSKPGETEKPDYYPIPDFSKAKESLQGKTRIRLEELKDGRTASDIMTMIFGEEKPGDLCQSFIDQKVFLFLDRISKFSFRVNGNETEFNREEHLEKNYWRKERILDIEKPSHWESEEKKFEIKKRMTVLFPKKQPGEFEIDDSKKPVYCTLPVSNFSLRTPFYMNIPLLELDDSRKSLQTATASEWNVSVIESAFKEITEIFKDAVGNKLDGLNLENLYHYFPYEYLKNTEDSNLIMRECREELSGFLCGTAFLRMTRNGYVFEACSINDIKNNNRKLLLPDYMYWWFGKCNGVNGFEYEQPFLYYDGTTVDEKDQTVGAHTSIKEKLTGVLYGTHSYDFFGNIGNKSKEEEYLYNKANELSLNLEDTKDDIEKIQEALSDGNKLPFGGLLKKVFKSDQHNTNIRRTVFRAFLQYCLGESLDNKLYHCLDEDGEVVLNDYTNINPIIEQLKSFFAEGNDPIPFWDGELEFIKSGFVNLVESPYIEYQRERWTDKISDKKLRLNPEQIVGKLNKNCELLAQKTRELFEDSDLVNNNVETIKEWIDRDEPVLFGNSKNNGSTVGITKEIYFCCRNCSFGDFNDRVVGLDSFGETIKNVLGWRLLDTGIMEPEFYKNVDDISFLLKVLEVYKDKKEDYKESLNNHLCSCSEGSEKKYSELFKFCLETYNTIQWYEKFKRFIPFCTQETLDKTVLTFAENDIQSIGKGLKDRFNDIYSDNIQNKEINVWGKDGKDSSESLPLKKIIEKRFYLVNDCRTGRQSLYCKAKNKNNESCIVLFTEEAFGTSIKELYDCKGFSEPNPYVPMNCMPGNMLQGWEDYPALTIGEVDKIKDYVRDNCISSDNEEGLIEKLFSPFVFRTDKLFEIRGYGGESSDEKRCPVCDAVLLAEASSLKIKQISYRPGNKHIDLPIMLCNNCSNAFRYAKDVEWKPGNWQDELQINNVNNNEMNTTSIEFSFPNGLKVKEVRMSYLLRVIWWLLVEDVEEQKQE